MSAPVRIGIIGLNHPHIYGMTKAVVSGGAELVAVFASEDDLASPFLAAFPSLRRVAEAKAILEDERIQLVLIATVPSERAAMGISAMRHGKDVMSDKPAFLTLAELAEVRAVQAETGRIYSISYSERFDEPATVHAGELVAAGAIGRVVQTLGVGPHRLNPQRRPSWFFRRESNGGIFADIGVHQMDQFLYFTGSTEAQVSFARGGNLAHPQFPGIDDYGEAMLTGDGGDGYVRVDWLAPDGMPKWGDGRLTILGTEGYIEIRKYVDIAGRPEGGHLFMVDKKGVTYIDCSLMPCPYGRLLVQDIIDRTETAMPQAHCFLASQLALEAQALLLGQAPP